MGGDVNTLNIFTLGLGPWLTSMIILMLISYRNMDKYMKQTSLEKHYKRAHLNINFKYYSKDLFCDSWGDVLVHRAARCWLVMTFWHGQMVGKHMDCV